MIIFLYGPDSFRSKQKLNEIIMQYKEVRKSGLNLVYLDAKEAKVSDLLDNFKIASMFAEKKLVILKNVFLNKKFQEDLLEEIKNLIASDNIIVIYENEAVDKRGKLFKLLDKEIKCQEFELPDFKTVKIWLKKELEKNNAKMEADAEDLLLNYIGNDLWSLSNEVLKLSNYSSAEADKDGKVINIEDVEILVKPKIDSDIFKTIEAMASRNKKLALDLLHNHIENGDHSLYLLSMITYQFRNLLILKESGGKRTGLHPFVVQKTMPLCAKFSFEELKKIYWRIFEIDSDIKTGKIDAELAIDMLVAEI